MEYALKERIGKPELFTGRKEELAYFLKWIDNIKDEKSQSTAMLARRKMGKTAIMERLFNITFFKNHGVIPFYYEIKENDIWIVDFCQDFFLTFIYQYIAFKTRKTEYLKPEDKSDFEKLSDVAKKEGLDYLTGIIAGAAHAVAHEKIDILWSIVREAPQTIAFRQDEFIVQMIDEFQFMNALIYWDRSKKNLAKNLAGGYLSTAESKIAPLLVSGSWVGWLMDELNNMLPARFRHKYLKNMPEDEASELLFKYSRFFDVPVTEETAFSIVAVTEGNPFYISSVIRSDYPGKDLTSFDGLTGTLEFETLDDQGLIKSSWMEYIAKAFPKINDKNAKNIVLHLSKHRDREWTRDELREALNLEMPDSDLEKKLKTLVKADIINKGSSYYCYRGVNDNIFDKVFRGVYDEEIRKFDTRVIRNEYNDELKKEKRFSIDEVKEFRQKFAEIKKRENLERVVGFIFSRSGFTKEAEAYCREQGIACSEDERWLESGK
jgi:hypothetical protein